MTVARHAGRRGVRSRVPGSRWLWLVAALPALGLGGVVAFRATRPLEAGPVNVDAQDRVSFVFKTGQAGSLGWIVLHNAGDRTAVLESVRPVGVDRGLEVDAIYAAGAGRSSAGYCCTSMWPPSKELASLAFRPTDLRPVRGTRVEPDRATPRDRAYGAAIVLVVRADRPGDYAFRGLAVRYRVGDRRYRRVVTNAFTMCVSDDGRRRCTAKEGYTAEQAANR